MVTLQSFVTTFGRKYVVCPVLTVFSLSDKTKKHSLPENLDELSDLSIGFVASLVVLIDIYSS